MRQDVMERFNDEEKVTRERSRFGDEILAGRVEPVSLIHNLFGSDWLV